MRYWKIKMHLNNNLRENKYYEALSKLIDDFYSYFKYDCFKFKLTIWFAIIIFCGLFFIILFCKDSINCFDSILFRNQINNNLLNENNVTINQNNKIPNQNNVTINKNKKKLTNDENLKKIVKFLKEQKHNKEVLNEYCSICLEKLNDNDERIAEDLDSVTLRLLHNNENEKIDTLICVHKFHSYCISKISQINNNCPLCKQKNNINYNQNEISMIYGLQNELNNYIYSEINYNDLYLNDSEDT